MNAHTKFTYNGKEKKPAAEQKADSAGTNANGKNNEAVFYKSREPIYPKMVKGTFRRLKWIVMAITLGIYYATPWLRWDRGPHAPNQAVLVDLAHERFYFFFIEIWPQEVYYITGLLILAALGIFLAAAMFGRVWCGYACPQTVWTDLFIYVENLIEGDRAARIRLAKAPWTAGKVGKRTAKHLAWLLIGVATGGAWVFYFADAPTLAYTMFTGQGPLAAYAAVAGLTFTTYSLGGLMREQVCTYMCPWPRIQASLTDADTLQVTYRYDRGEPRGPHKKGQPWDSRGHCIDCGQCVAACPMGIDIRNGAQLECINCALCIDACDDVMTRIDLPKGLIGYDTDANIARRIAGQPQRFDFIRPRTVLYGVFFLVVAAVMAYSLSTRATLGLDALRDRNPDFVTLSDGSVRNGYTLKLLNHANATRTFLLDLSGAKPSKVTVIGIEHAVFPVRITVEADRVRSVRLLLTLAPNQLRSETQPLTFTLKDAATGEMQTTGSLFVSGQE
ncbi:MAG TPA: cytochrome c oxidase accessory protein CcoG [Rhizomicrobium sp.]|nr:cytochrome c oxidase accessory protein CcoG [Rhizomicrobium sp.]